MEDKIHYVKRQELDAGKWDACIERATNGLIYAYAGYLDRMADNWDALIWNDYEAVMPLPWRRKGGFYYLYQPAFAAQLGLFGKDVHAAQLEASLDAIPRRFRYWDISLNHGNVCSLPSYPLYQRTNFILSLDSPYTDLLSGYRDNIRRNIRKAEQLGCYAEKNIPVKDILALAREQPQQQIKETDAANFSRLYADLSGCGRAISYGIFSARHQLLSSSVFYFSHARAYYILVGNHPDGRTLGASHALIDAFIRDHAGQQLLLDFEGSDLRNLAFFYGSFGAVEERYAALRMNKLPFYVRWLKK
jgi:hypothetical protein